MAKALVSKRKADILSNGAGLVGILLLIFMKSWWPGLLLVMWATLFVRQWLTGRMWDATITTIILVGLWVKYFFGINFSTLVPVLFTLGAIYIIFREYCYKDDTNGEEKSEEIKDDIEDDGDAS